MELQISTDQREILRSGYGFESELGVWLGKGCGTHPRLEVRIRTEFLGVQEGAERWVMVEQEEPEQVEWLPIRLAVSATKIAQDVCRHKPTYQYCL